MIKSIVAFFTAVIMFFIGIFLPNPPENNPGDPLPDFTGICQIKELPEKLYVINSGSLKSQEERHLLTALQGIVAKTSPCIYLKHSSMCDNYLSQAAAQGIEIVYTDENGNAWTLETLLKKFKSHIGDSGYVLYRKSEKAEGLNVATNLAALYGWLPVHESLEPLAKNAGLTLKEDYSDTDYNVLFQWSFFEKHKEEFSYGALASLKYSASGIRDLAISQGFFTFYIDDDEDTNLFRGAVMEYAGDNTPVLGWVKYEVAFVDQASDCGNMAIPSDHSHNLSFLSSLRCEIPEQKHVAKQYTDPTKHYCALVFSDGDNMQWIHNGYGEFYQKLALKEQFPMTWSFPPFMQELSSVTVNKIYNDATNLDYFIAGVSGAGYIHPTQYPAKALEGFTDITAATMAKSKLSYVQILDKTPDNLFEEAKLKNTLQYYARFDNIKGGVLSLDPTRYAGGKGRIFFVNDKPFISYRLSLWHPDGENADVTTDWLDAQAATVNSYPADIKSINGYSVINIHPWSVSVKNLAYFVSRLDDDVVLVGLDELMTMIEENIPHEDTAPDR